MNSKKYLERITYGGTSEPTLATLSGLQEAHLLSVPFENLDIHRRTKIILEPSRLYHKIVVERRGGFCYELNGLFYHLLLELGFSATLVSGRVFDRDSNTYGQEFDHMLNLVTLDRQQWIVDVGFGEFTMHPIPLLLDQPLEDTSGRFIIEAGENGQFTVSKYSHDHDRFIPEYMFSQTKRCMEDFTEMCIYHQTSPDSHFTRQRICTIATPSGRVTLTDRRLIVRRDSRREELAIDTEEHFRKALSQHFHIQL